MTTFCFFIYAIFSICLTTYFVFTFAKEIKIIQGISSMFLVPAIGILSIIFLLPFEQDSYHVVEIIFYAFIALSLCQILESFFSNKVTLIIQGIFFIASMFFLSVLCKSTFYIYRTDLWVTILAASVYLLSFILLFAIFVKKQSPIFSILTFICFALVSFIHYSSLVYLVFNHSAGTILRFIGTTFLFGYVVFQILNHSAIDLKFKKPISLMILLASLIFIAVSNVLIFIG